MVQRNGMDFCFFVILTLFGVWGGRGRRAESARADFERQ